MVPSCEVDLSFQTNSVRESSNSHSSHRPHHICQRYTLKFQQCREVASVRSVSAHPETGQPLSASPSWGRVGLCLSVGRVGHAWWLPGVRGPPALRGQQLRVPWERRGGLKDSMHWKGRHWGRWPKRLSGNSLRAAQGSS